MLKGPSSLNLLLLIQMRNLAVAVASLLVFKFFAFFIRFNVNPRRFVLYEDTR